MVVPIEQDGKSAEPLPDIIDEDQSTRQGGLKEAQIETTNKVIVDMREFRSELPSLLHQRDIEIEPVTLLVSLLLHTFIMYKYIHTKLIITFFCR